MITDCGHSQPGTVCGCCRAQEEITTLREALRDLRGIYLRTLDEERGPYNGTPEEMYEIERASYLKERDVLAGVETLLGVEVTK